MKILREKGNGISTRKCCHHNSSVICICETNHPKLSGAKQHNRLLLLSLTVSEPTGLSLVVLLGSLGRLQSEVGWGWSPLQGLFTHIAGGRCRLSAGTLTGGLSTWPHFVTAWRLGSKSKVPGEPGGSCIAFYVSLCLMIHMVSPSPVCESLGPAHVQGTGTRPRLLMGELLKNSWICFKTMH